jgi:hypothetical protein
MNPAHVKITSDRKTREEVELEWVLGDGRQGRGRWRVLWGV